VSKTERALDSDSAALDELDDFVATEAAEADRAIGELIDDAVEPSNGNGNGHGPVDIDEYEEIIGANGFDPSEVELADDIDASLDSVDEVDLTDDVELELDDAADIGELVETDDGIVDDQIADVEQDDEVADEVEVADEQVDEDVAADDEAYVLPEIVPATDEDEPDDAEGVDDESAGAPVAAAAAAAALTTPDAREGDLDEVSDDIIEELRRADIDGPVVDFAPQDDTTSARRRPKRRPDYDPAPVPIPARPPRILGRKPRVRKVTRVVRHVDPWSVFKIAAVAFMVLYGVMLTASVLLWNVAYATGTVDNVERFFESFGWSSFEFNGGEIYHAGWIIGLFAVIGLTGFAVLSATLFNLITDIVGGMRFTVLEEEVVETRTSPMRRFVIRRPEPEVPAHISDSSGSLIREAVVDDSGAIER